MRYYGCKDKLLKNIEISVRKTEIYEGAKFVDLFTGTTSVAKHFKRLGYTVIANDNLEFCYALAKTYIELNEVPKFLRLKKAIGANQHDSPEKVIQFLNNLKPLKGFIYDNYCPTKTHNLRKYFSDENGMIIDSIRTQIRAWQVKKLINEQEYYYLLTSLIEAINLVSNVAGTYAACLKTWDRRALKKLKLVMPEIIPSVRHNKAYKRDANVLIRELKSDILYLDPPYNSRQYVTNYFLLELVAKGWFDKKPQISGIAGLVVDDKQKSRYSQKSTALATLSDLVSHARTRFILLSYNNEGLISDHQINKIMSGKGSILSNKGHTHKRYRSINQTESDPKNVKEMLYLVKVDGVKDRFNNLNGKNWLQYSFSIWKDIRKNAEEQKLKHPAMFPISLVERLIGIYAKKKKLLILDPFVGSGSTVIAGLNKKMKTIGIDLSREYIKMTEKRIESGYYPLSNKNDYHLYEDDANNLDKYCHPESVDLCITSPPYWDILNARRTADNKTIRNYGDSPHDLGNIPDYHEFIDSLTPIFTKTYQVIKKGGFCIVIVMDLRKKSKFYPFHMDISQAMSKSGFVLRDIIIWDRQAEYNNMKPLGYPYSFIVNKVHEYILIFEK